MAQFRTSTQGSDKTTNHEGGESFNMRPALELYTTAVNSTLDANNFYEGTQDRIERIRDLVRKNDDEFVAKLASYARQEMGLRSVPLVLTVELAKQHSGDDLVRRTARTVIDRADEIPEILAYYKAANNRTEITPLSKQLKKGIRDAFHKFDEYQFGKWEDLSKDVTIRDAMFLTRPEPNSNEERQVFEDIADGDLDAPYTWEVELSQVGEEYSDENMKRQAKRQKWEELVNSGRLGYFATLSNLRNMLEIGVSYETLQQVASKISNPEAVKGTRVLPFRFLSAYKALSGTHSTDTQILLDALEDAVEISGQNVPLFDPSTKALIATDFSGSMQDTLSQRGTIERYEVGGLLGRVLSSNIDRCISGIFGDEWKVTNDNPRGNILESTTKLNNRIGEVGHSTNGFKAIEYLVNRSIEVDEVFMFTDMELWDSTHGYSEETLSSHWDDYKKINPDATLYTFDLAGYGDSPISQKRGDVFTVAGWSTKVFEVLENLRDGEKQLSTIRNFDL